MTLGRVGEYVLKRYSLVHSGAADITLDGKYRPSPFRASVCLTGGLAVTTSSFTLAYFRVPYALQLYLHSIN
jgi:hypothetical protein